MNIKPQRCIMLLALVAALLVLTTGLTLAKARPARFAETWQVSDTLSTGFTYQGQLTDGGNPAEGSFDLQFELYDAETEGTLIGTVAQDDVAVTDGLFTVTLDFGAGAFDGQARWLAIGVRPGDETGAYTPLLPRQPLTAAPYAQYAPEAGNVAWEDVSANPIPASCAAGEILAWNNTLSIWECVPNTGTTYAAGTGLELDGSTFNVLTTTVQTRISGACAVGSTIRAINEDGSVACQVDAHLNRTVAPSVNFSTTLDTVGNVGQYYSSITIGADGLPVISYYRHDTNEDLKVAHCDDAACTTATTTAVDTTGDVGQYSSITIGADGLPVISYYDASNDDLKVAHCDNAACTSATLTTVDNTDDVGQYSSITIGADGLPVISYYDYTNCDLKVAHCADAACTSATLTTVDSTGSVGKYTSITIGADGLPLISYYDEDPNYNLKVAHCDNTVCASATRTAVDVIGYVGWDTSITIGADGLPIISYSNWTSDNLKVAHCADAACTTSTTTTVDTTGNVGEYTSITIGADGLPLISYYDDTNDDLKVVHCSNTFCVPYFRRR